MCADGCGFASLVAFVALLAKEIAWALGDEAAVVGVADVVGEDSRGGVNLETV